MGTHDRSFVPAAGLDWLLPLYDPLQKLIGADAARRKLLEQASLSPTHTILDVGCGTGSLVVRIKRLHPEAEVFGLDPDAKALARARVKARRAGVSVQLDEGFADELPYPDARFDRVFSAFMLHHLKQHEKGRALAEIHRVLAPGGSLHLLDFGGPGPRNDGFLARKIHGAHPLRDHFEDRIPDLMDRAGFFETGEIAHRTTPVGRIAYFAATRPGAGPRD
jgi:ubiquinone/menaquinone biosynthesis C-methylase UbiE